jgi:hypothetical protein
MDGAKAKLYNFKKFIENETALLEEIWNEVDKTGWQDQGRKETLAPANFRWLLTLSIYRRNNNILRQDYRDFVAALFDNTQGGSSIIERDGGRGTFALSLSDLTKLGPVQDILKTYVDPSVRSKKKRRRDNVAQIKRGRANAHIKPYAKYGDGQTTTKSAIQNMSDGQLYGDDTLFGS